MSIELTDDQYLDLLLRGQKSAARRGGCGGLVYGALALVMIVAFAVLTADRLGYVPPSILGPFVGTPQTTFSTPLPTARPQQPPAQPIGGGAAPWPTLTPEPAAQDEPTLTVPPVLTATPSFWTPAEQTQIAATATAFIEVVPTAPPAFVEYATSACSDPEQVAESLTLQLFCKR